MGPIWPLTERFTLFWFWFPCWRSFCVYPWSYCPFNCGPLLLIKHQFFSFVSTITSAEVGWEEKGLHRFPEWCWCVNKNPSKNTTTWRSAWSSVWLRRYLACAWQSLGYIIQEHPYKHPFKKKTYNSFLLKKWRTLWNCETVTLSKVISGLEVTRG